MQTGHGFRLLQPPAETKESTIKKNLDLISSDQVALIMNKKKIVKRSIALWICGPSQPI